MKTKRKAWSFLLAVAMVLSLLGTSAFATGGEVTQATINGETAAIETVGSYNYIRATLDGTDAYSASEHSLRHADVILVATAAPTAAGITFMDAGGGYYYAEDVDLFNQVYTVTVDGTAYRLAAGLKNGEVAIDAGDPLRITGMTVGDSTNGTVSMSFRAVNVQNPEIGEPQWENDLWTGISYTAYSSASISTAYNLSALHAVISVPSGTTVSGSSVTANGDGAYTLNLGADSDRTITLTNNGVTRTYYVFVTQGSTVNVSLRFNTTNVTGTANLALAATLQASMRAVNSTGTVNCTLASGGTVFDALQSVTTTAGISLVYTNSSFGAYITGIGGLTAGGSAGWMYKVNGTLPMVGAGSYALSNGDEIVWGYVQSWNDTFT